MLFLHVLVCLKLELLLVLFADVMVDVLLHGASFTLLPFFF
jgi:hypothetical protein